MVIFHSYVKLPDEGIQQIAGKILCFHGSSSPSELHPAQDTLHHGQHLPLSLPFAAKRKQIIEVHPTNIYVYTSQSCLCKGCNYPKIYGFSWTAPTPRLHQEAPSSCDLRRSNGRRPVARQCHPGCRGASLEEIHNRWRETKEEFCSK